MGTRNLTMVIHKEEIKIAQYGQWDGYPEGNGVTILTFLRNKERVKKLTNKLKNIRFETDKDEEELKTLYTPIRCVKKYDLDKLPTKKQFISELKKIEKE